MWRAARVGTAMNMPELLGATGARSTPKPSDDGIGSADQKNNDAFMASMLSATEKTGDGSAGESDFGAEDSAKQFDGSESQLRAGPSSDGADTKATEIAIFSTSSVDQARSKLGNAIAAETQLARTANPKVSLAQTADASVSAAKPDIAADAHSETGTVASDRNALSTTGPRDPATATGSTLAELRPGRSDQQTQPRQGTLSAQDQASKIATGQPGTAPSQDALNVTIKTTGASYQQSPQQAHPLTAHETRPKASTARSAEQRAHPSEKDIEIQLTEDAADQRVERKKESNDPIAKTVTREEPMLRTTNFRTTAANGQPQILLSNVDGTAMSSVPGSSTTAAQAVSPRDATPEIRASQTANAQDGPSKSTLHQITAALRNQPLLQKIDLTLDPPELGRIEIQMEVAESGMRATLAAERAATGEIIRRQAELLIQQLDDAGFNDVSLEFKEFGARDDRGSSSGPEPDRASSRIPGETVADHPVAGRRYAIPDSGMDIRL